MKGEDPQVTREGTKERKKPSRIWDGEHKTHPLYKAQRGNEEKPLSRRRRSKGEWERKEEPTPPECEGERKEKPSHKFGQGTQNPPFIME